jgi:hypothetical protein
MADTDKCSLCKRHDHVTARDRLVSLAKLCPNLKTLFVLCNCPFEDNYNPFALTGSKGTTFVSWLQEFVQLCPSLEVLVPPMECVTGRTIGRIYSPLTQLKELYLTETACVVDFRQIAGHFPQLRKISLFHFEAISLRAFLQFVDLAPNLDTVHLHHIRFGDYKYDDDDDEESIPPRNLEYVGEDLVELSGRSRFLFQHGVQFLTIAPTGWFSKLRGLDIGSHDYRSIEPILDLVAQYPILDAIHIAPETAAALFPGGRNISQAIPERITVFTRLPPIPVPSTSFPGDTPMSRRCRIICEKNEALYDTVRKAILDGRVRTDWYKTWGWRNDAYEDAILHNWENYKEWEDYQ